MRPQYRSVNMLVNMTIVTRLNNKLAHWNGQLDKVEHTLAHGRLNRNQKRHYRRQQTRHLRVINKLAEQANWLENTGQVQCGEIRMSY